MSWNWKIQLHRQSQLCHAPRERVSWNMSNYGSYPEVLVTLHVSVWVEICFLPVIHSCTNVTLHVSVWVEICIWYWNVLILRSRSTWACELKWSCLQFSHHLKWSRSTWACELKLHLTSWSLNKLPVTLHVSVWVEISKILKIPIHTWSRSTWACELKFDNVQRRIYTDPNVTLHVSVWVEIVK